MASVFFLPSSGTAAVSPAPGADWDHANTVSRPMPTTPSNSAIASENYLPDSSDHAVDADSLVAQFVSDIIPPSLISAQHIGLFLPCFEYQSANDLTLTWKFYVVDTTGTTVLHTLIPLTRNGTEVYHLGFRGIGDVRSCSLTDVTVSHRLVLEAGLGGTPDGAGFQPRHNGSIQVGDPTFSGQPDLVRHNDAPGYAMLLLTRGMIPTSGASGTKGWAI